MIIKINNKPISVEIKYSRRKTVYLRIVSQDSIEIRSPFGINNKKLLDFIIRNQVWIINELNEASINTKVRLYKDGEVFFYQGQVYTLKVHIGHNDFVLIDKSDNTINIKCKYSKDVKDVLIKWYKAQAGYYIKERVNYYQNVIGVRSDKISIKNQKTLWGSCSTKKNLNFNMRLIMMPHHVVDYVIVHELCHLIHFNHSKEFWGKVEEIIPDYIETRKYLKQNGVNYYL
ncbi:MAG: SprT family zinc-dependent metalloprotease [Clostridiaceae bacterium]